MGFRSGLADDKDALKSLRLNRKKPKKLEIKADIMPKSDESVLDQASRKTREVITRESKPVAKKKLNLKPKAKKPSLFKGVYSDKASKKIETSLKTAIKGVADEEGKKQGVKSLLDDDGLQMAAVGLLPMLIGGLLGGEDGALMGMQAGGVGVEELQKGKAREAAGKVKQQELALDSRELDIKEQAAKGSAKLTTAKTRLVESQTKALSLKKLEGLNDEKLRKEYNKETSGLGTNKVMVAFQRIKASAKKPSAAGDLALIFNYMKMLDPGSTVREGEFANAQNSGGVPDRISAKYNEMIRGERLSGDMRDDFLSRSGDLMQAQLVSQETIDNRYFDIAQRTGKDPTLVIDPAYQAARVQGKEVKKEDEQPLAPVFTTEQYANEMKRRGI